MKTLLAVTLTTLMATPAAAAGLLDGVTFQGSWGREGKPAEGTDALIFQNGMFRSTGCDAYGFTAAPYTVTREGDAIVFTATTTSPTSGTITWSGRVRNGALEGTFVWKRYLVFRRTYWINATQK